MKDIRISIIKKNQSSYIESEKDTYDILIKKKFNIFITATYHSRISKESSKIRIFANGKKPGKKYKKENIICRILHT
jgi:hypothetical protein